MFTVDNLPDGCRNKKKTVKFFYEKFGIPAVLGCIDGTHVNIIAPKDAKHLYRNRKQKFSLYVTLVSMCH